MYLWRRFATQEWANQNEAKVRMIAGNKLAIVERPDRKRFQFEVASNRQADLQELTRNFGGRIGKLPRDWLKRSLSQKTRPIRIGERSLIIPAGAAFGTGEHATTAMCLRMLERLFQLRGRSSQAGRLRSQELVIDLGTGSGILALAAKVLGAKQVIGIDSDPIAISTAKQNAVLNKIRDVEFRVADVRRLRFERDVDVVTANLFSELLIGIVPNLRAARWLILSGILRNQETDVKRALIGTKVGIHEVRRRGKWVAMLAGRK